MKKLVGLFVMSLLLTVTIAAFLLGGVKIDKVQAQSGGFVCPVADIVATSCKGPKDCLYQNPKSCNNYIQCTVNADGVTGTPVVRTCAPSVPALEWNDNIKRCVFPPSPTCPR